MVWFGPSVRAVAASWSLATPNTQELSRVVVSVAVGAPGFALPDPVAPTAPEPLVPDGSTPLKLTTVMDEGVACACVAVTVKLDRGAAAKARQISEVACWTLVRVTSCQVRPPPATPVTVEVVTLSTAIKASSNSFVAFVEKGAV